MSEEIKQINSDILRVTQSVVVYRQEYSKFGGYEGNKEIYTMDIAKALYKAGYRKQIEGEWVKVGFGITERVVCSQCNSEKGSFMRPPFCNQCGAKMKG